MNTESNNLPQANSPSPGRELRPPKLDKRRGVWSFTLRTGAWLTRPDGYYYTAEQSADVQAIYERERAAQEAWEAALRKADEIEASGLWLDRSTVGNTWDFGPVVANVQARLAWGGTAQMITVLIRDEIRVFHGEWRDGLPTLKAVEGDNRRARTSNPDGDRDLALVDTTSVVKGTGVFRVVWDDVDAEAALKRQHQPAHGGE